MDAHLGQLGSQGVVDVDEVLGGGGTGFVVCRVRTSPVGTAEGGGPGRLVPEPLVGQPDTVVPGRRDGYDCRPSSHWTRITCHIRPNRHRA